MRKRRKFNPYLWMELGVLGGGGPAPLVNLITNGTLDTDSSWIKATNATIADGVLHYTAVAANGLTFQLITLPSGATYTVVFTVKNYSAGGVRATVANGSVGTTRTSNGTYVEVLTAGASNYFGLQARDAATTLDIDNVQLYAGDVSSQL